MRHFAYQRVETAGQAVRATPAAFLAGGTTLVDLMRMGSMRPEALVDINDLAKVHGQVRAGTDGLHLGALVRMAEAADNPVVIRDYPVIAQSLSLAASAQIRNMASLGGNVLQRTRCPYFREPSWRACNKRDPGSGCEAISGPNRLHAVLGVSNHCIATYAGDFGQSLVALDATVDLAGPSGARVIRFEDLHKPPGDTPQIETNLKPGELITGFTVGHVRPPSATPASAHARGCGGRALV